MRKFTKTAFAAIALFFGSISAFAQNYQVNINGIEYTLNAAGTGYNVTRTVADDFSSTDVVIRSEVDGLPVTGLAGRIFQNNKTITSCVIPNTVKEFVQNPNDGNKTDGQFNGCEALKSVTLSDQLPSITNYMFSSTALEEITIPASVTTIDYQAFCAWTDKSKASLKKVIFAEGSKLDQLGDECFKNREGLLEINLEACTKLRRFAGSIFQNCKSMKTITIPASLSVCDGKSHFNGCSALETVIFEPGCQIPRLGNYMFQNCPNIQSLTIPAAVKIIDTEFCGWTKAIRSIAFEEGSQLETIGEKAFRQNLFPVLDLSVCHKLKKIYAAAFKECANLEKVYLPDNLELFISNGSFAACNNMKYMVINYAGDWNTLLEENPTPEHFTTAGATTSYPIYINENATNVPADVERCTVTPVAPITVSATGYATYFNSSAIDLPSTLEAAYVEGVAEKALQYNWAYASHDAVPAATGMVVRGAEGTYTPALVETAAFEGTNLLKGSDAEATTEGADLYYKLSLDAEQAEGSLGFYWGAENGAAFTNGAHEAYLALTLAQAEAVKAFRLDGTYDEDTTTGIKTYEKENQNGNVYNLAGQRVNANQKGIVISNGRKIVNK